MKSRFWRQDGRPGKNDRRPTPITPDSAISLIVECRRCGVEFSPQASAYVSGDWRVCPACRVATQMPYGAQSTDWKEHRT